MRKFTISGAVTASIFTAGASFAQIPAEHVQAGTLTCDISGGIGSEIAGSRMRKSRKDLNVHPTQLRNWVKALAADPQQASAARASIVANVNRWSPHATAGRPIGMPEFRNVAGAAGARKTSWIQVSSNFSGTGRGTRPMTAPTRL